MTENSVGQVSLLPNVAMAGDPLLAVALIRSLGKCSFAKRAWRRRSLRVMCWSAIKMARPSG